jgi:hypothetical protein
MAGSGPYSRALCFGDGDLREQVGIWIEELRHIGYEARSADAPDPEHQNSTNGRGNYTKCE